MKPYRNLALMVVTSSTLMFGLMYLHTYQFDHVWFSQTRLFMTLIMAGGMTLVMLFFMRHMYKSTRANVAVVVVGAGLMAAGLALVRSQVTVGDVAYMKGMIPHHSIAVLTSERARIEDVRVRTLAQGIIATQKREIDQMRRLIEDIRAHGVRRQP